MNWLYIESMNRLQSYSHRHNRPMPFGDAMEVTEGHGKTKFEKILADAIQAQLDSYDGQIGVNCVRERVVVYPDATAKIRRQWFLPDLGHW